MHRSLGKTIWICTVLIIVFGLMAVYSTSHQNIRVTNKVFYDQLFFAFFGFLIMFAMGRIDYRKFYDMAYILYVINILLLVLVLVAGRHALGARRWFELGGLSFQPSELTKISLILLLGRYFSDHKASLTFNTLGAPQLLFRDLLLPLILTVVPMLLIFKQPDLGSAILIFGIFLIMLFASGLHYKVFLAFLGVCMFLAPFGWHVLWPYQKDRLLVFLNPNIDPLGAGYTIIQSKIAVGSGQLFGRGWLSGTQNQLNFLPERHTDFIFSAIGEEWGLVGTVFLLSCYFLLIGKGIKIAEQVKDDFGTLVTVGIVGILSLQVIINIGMVLGLCPVVGITLPLISYGRTSFLVFIIMMGFLYNLSKRRIVF